MRSNNFFVLFFALFISLASCSSDKDRMAANVLSEKQAGAIKGIFPYKEGELIKYDIKSLGVKAGEATLQFKGLQKDPKGRATYLIIFTARAMNFFDEERIFTDPTTFYPLIVERDINIWGKKEKITEDYDQQKGVFELTKLAHGKTTKEVYPTKAPIDNIYSFIYRYRKIGEFKVGGTISVPLPTKEIKMDLLKMTKLNTGGQIYDAYLLQSDPAKYKVWFDAGNKKIPLRINGAVGISDTAMTMVEYTEGKSK